MFNVLQVISSETFQIFLKEIPCVVNKRLRLFLIGLFRYWARNRVVLQSRRQSLWGMSFKISVLFDLDSS